MNCKAGGGGIELCITEHVCICVYMKAEGRRISFATTTCMYMYMSMRACTPEGVDEVEEVEEDGVVPARVLCRVYV